MSVGDGMSDEVSLTREVPSPLPLPYLRPPSLPWVLLGKMCMMGCCRCDE